MKRYFKVGSIPQIYSRIPQVNEDGVKVFFGNTCIYDNYRDLDKRYQYIVEKVNNDFSRWQASNNKMLGMNYDWKILNTKLVFEKNLPSIKVEVESQNINEENEKKFNSIYRVLMYKFKETVWESGFRDEFVIRGDHYIEGMRDIPLKCNKITEKSFNKE